ncbi:glutamate-rich protein 1 isoform X1 [Octodon degus]|uniref:Glutamate-rich protein 1 isoform X1 n=1 Tax=Octodon degus TaxID=10160 RepID=A0A6P6DEF7_OCTDE|nr:glutamate-rich protein 1 isoform X1 [Octodon degus]
MSALRRRVFVEKVLKKLFPNVSSSQVKGTPGTLTSETPLEKVTSETVKSKHGHHLTDGRDVRIQPRRLYTVSPPPEGYVPCLPEPASCAESEKASSAGDTEADQEPHDQPKKRIRKHKLKRKFKNSNNHVEQAELEQQRSLLQAELPQHTDGPTISKNKKRKLKKKQQIRRKRAAGLVTKASSVSFTYQPEETGSEQEDISWPAGGGAASATEEAAEGTSAEADTAPSQEDMETTNRKAEGILKFLQSTREMYFYDGVSKDTDSAVRVEAAEELFRCLESRHMTPSDVLILDHMKTLLLLHDTARLRRALELLPEHCTMPRNHARVISAFFNYWITHVLPEKNSE